MFTRQTVSGFCQFINDQLSGYQVVFRKSQVPGSMVVIEVDDDEPSAGPDRAGRSGKVSGAVVDVVVGIAEK
jgi:hypothetical protein